MSDGTAISTERLLLRPWRDQDREPFAAMNADTEVMRYFAAPLIRQESDDLADGIARRLLYDGFGLWAVERIEGAEFIGFVGLAPVPFPAHFTPAVEVGWRLSRPHWGFGFATEAAAAAVRFGFDEVGLGEVVSFTVPANRRSIAVMERIGMSRDAADDFDHPRFPESHPLRRHLLYRLRPAGA